MKLQRELLKKIKRRGAVIAMVTRRVSDKVILVSKKPCVKYDWPEIHFPNYYNCIPSNYSALHSDTAKNFPRYFFYNKNLTSKEKKFNWFLKKCEHIRMIKDNSITRAGILRPFK